MLKTLLLKNGALMQVKTCRRPEKANQLGGERGMKGCATGLSVNRRATLQVKKKKTTTVKERDSGRHHCWKNDQKRKKTPLKTLSTTFSTADWKKGKRPKAQRIV